VALSPGSGHNAGSSSATSVSDPVEVYKASFRVAVQESWPAGFASQLQSFFSALLAAVFKTSSPESYGGETADIVWAAWQIRG